MASVKIDPIECEGMERAREKVIASYIYGQYQVNSSIQLKKIKLYNPSYDEGYSIDLILFQITLL